MRKVIFYVFGLIALYLIATNASRLNEILSTLSSQSIKGVVALQGREVKGVTY